MCPYCTPASQEPHEEREKGPTAGFILVVMLALGLLLWILIGQMAPKNESYRIEVKGTVELQPLP
jgi:uncharacterized membrane protein